MIRLISMAILFRSMRDLVVMIPV